MPKTKFECIPYIQDSSIGEIEVSIELTDDEIKQVKLMSKEEYEKFIKQKEDEVIACKARITDCLEFCFTDFKGYAEEREVMGWSFPQ